ncbi:MAG: phosphatase PAP2 family protein [Elusimicrobia bacterium]|nr:phosphatase PAP2 family protein [Elusimicrobiota bacterium]
MNLARRLSALWPWKLALTLALNVWVCVPYFWLQRRVFFPVTPMPVSRLDALIPFSAWTVWLYQSLYLLTPVGPWLSEEREPLLRYAFGLAGISLLCDAFFLFFPTSVLLRPDPAGLDALYRLLVRMDAPLNAFPSLHAALAVYSALCCRALVRGGRDSGAWKFLPLTWSGFIIYATLATKQHVVIDAIGGTALGAVGYWAAFVWSAERSVRPAEAV